MSTINLAPGTKYLAGIRRRRRTLFTLSAALFLILVGIWGALFALQYRINARVAEAKETVATLDRKIAAAADDVARVAAFEARLGAAEQLVAQHVSYQPLFLELERLLPPPTVLTSLEVSTKEGTVKVSGVSPNIDEIALTLASLKNQSGRSTIFTRASLESVTREDVKGPDGAAIIGTSYKFAAEMNFAPAVLQPNKTP